MFIVFYGQSYHPVDKNADRTSSYPHFKNILKYDGIDFPINIKHIPKLKL